MGLGCMGISFGYGEPLQKARAITLLREAYQQGVTVLVRPRPTGLLPMKN